MSRESSAEISTAEEPALIFGPFCVEAAKRLWRDGQLVDIRPRPLAMLRKPKCLTNTPSLRHLLLTTPKYCKTTSPISGLVRGHGIARGLPWRLEQKRGRQETQ